jgi:manganese/zinc/iron transport system ATP- binding protein
MKKQALLIESLHVSYGQTPVLWDISCAIPEGAMVAIVGPNGAGKSTLLRAVLGMTPPISGKIECFGAPIRKVRGRIAYVPQRAAVDWDFPITARDLVLMGRTSRFGLFGRPKAADWDAAELALQRVGMSACADRQIGELSGGQQQRLFVARALVRDPDLFLMDEPFVGIDSTTEAELFTLLRQQKERGKTLCIVHHDLPSVEEHFDWVIMLNTRLVVSGPVKEVFRSHLTQTFGRHSSLFDEALTELCRSLTT